MRSAKRSGNLRTALWRVKKACPDLIEKRGRRSLSTHVSRCAGLPPLGTRRPDFGTGPGLALPRTSLADGAAAGWYDDWLLLSVSACASSGYTLSKRTAANLAARHSFAEALDAALAALADEPLRESANQLVFHIHAAEGNVSEALRQFQRFRRMLQAELGVELNLHRDSANRLGCLRDRRRVEYLFPRRSLRRALEPPGPKRETDHDGP